MDAERRRRRKAGDDVEDGSDRLQRVLDVGAGPGLAEHEALEPVAVAACRPRGVLDVTSGRSPAQRRQHRRTGVTGETAATRDADEHRQQPVARHAVEPQRDHVEEQAPRWALVQRTATTTRLDALAQKRLDDGGQRSIAARRDRDARARRRRATSSDGAGNERVLGVLVGQHAQRGRRVVLDGHDGVAKERRAQRAQGPLSDDVDGDDRQPRGVGVGLERAKNVVETVERTAIGHGVDRQRDGDVDVARQGRQHGGLQRRRLERQLDLQRADTPQEPRTPPRAQQRTRAFERRRFVDDARRRQRRVDAACPGEQAAHLRRPTLRVFIDADPVVDTERIEQFARRRARMNEFAAQGIDGRREPRQHPRSRARRRAQATVVVAGNVFVVERAWFFVQRGAGQHARGDQAAGEIVTRRRRHEGRPGRQALEQLTEGPRARTTAPALQRLLRAACPTHDHQLGNHRGLARHDAGIASRRHVVEPLTAPLRRTFFRLVR